MRNAILFFMLFSLSAYAQVRVKENIKQQSVSSIESDKNIKVEKPRPQPKKRR